MLDVSKLLRKKAPKEPKKKKRSQSIFREIQGTGETMNSLEKNRHAATCSGKLLGFLP